MCDPLTECAICFESYADGTAHEAEVMQCCSQTLCKQCLQCLRRCPFCRHPLHDDDAEEQGNPWLRRRYPNPILIFAMPGLLANGVSLVGDAVAGARIAAVGAAAFVAEASPLAVAGGVAAGVVAAGGVAVMLASQHQEPQARRLRDSIRNRPRQQAPFRETASTLVDALQWFLAPQMKNMPHVYHGSVWRNAAREEHLAKMRALQARTSDESSPATSSSSSSPAERPAYRPVVTESGTLWGEMAYCFQLWLEYNPHTANWGTCVSYGEPPLHYCWHNRWREDLRHAVSDLARWVIARHDSSDLPMKQKRCALCLLATLDHVLSWDLVLPNLGKSVLVGSTWRGYSNFCEKLREKFAEAWAAAQAPPEMEMDLQGFDEHAEAMALRDVPEAFRDLW
eukprot:TRINITY_DN80546_c0_g1_i1.p1 TRINITY_DN80546_c0_g1~~TRINITY_DN80546_c0_g1_i1.p1  ORF type:complete len:427 (-),score=50.66 TRINITY_DN80546_c0_g1_i1:520-1707(-)